MKILLYGFKAFDEFEDNITEKIILALPEMKDVHTLVFDVEFNREMFERVFEEVQPDIIIGMGQHSRAEEIHIERIARNAWATREMKEPALIDESAEAQIEMSLDLPVLTGSRESQDAGTYVCNFSMYWSESYAHKLGIKAGFVHIPRKLSVESGIEFITAQILGFHSIQAP